MEFTTLLAKEGEFNPIRLNIQF